jgi:hypothetical protein
MTNHLHVPTTQFKTNLIVIRFFSSIEERTASAHALLPDVLLSGTTNHPTRRSLQQACEALYDTRLRTSVMRIGKERVTQFSVEFLDESVAPESVTNEAIQLLKEVLYQPLLVNGQFDCVDCGAREALDDRRNGSIARKQNHGGKQSLQRSHV